MLWWRPLSALPPHALAAHGGQCGAASYLPAPPSSQPASASRTFKPTAAPCIQDEVCALEGLCKAFHHDLALHYFF